MANHLGGNPRWTHVRYLKSNLDVSTETSLGRTLSPRVTRANCRDAWYRYNSERVRTAVYAYLRYWTHVEDPEQREQALRLEKELIDYRREQRRKKFARDVKAGRVPAKAPKKPKPIVPPGATMKVPGSDGFLHWSDGVRDLGICNESGGVNE
jgi:hypothetical protein